MNNKSRHILVFCKIVELGGISKAADDLALSKSVISQHLKTLETDLGVALLNRTTRRQTLTPVGKEFYQRCIEINQLTNHAWQQAQSSQSIAKGIVTISAPHALMDNFVAPAIGAVLRQHPMIKPILIASDQRQDLIKNNIDIAVRVGQSPDSEYKQLKIGQFRDVLCACEQYIKQYLGAGDLIDQDWAAINYIANSWQGNHVKHQLTHINQDSSVSLVFSPQRTANSLPTVVALTNAGVGISLLPSFIVEAQSQLKTIDKQYQLPMNQVYALHGYHGAKPKAVELCIEAIKLQMIDQH